MGDLSFFLILFVVFIFSASYGRYTCLKEIEEQINKNGKFIIGNVMVVVDIQKTELLNSSSEDRE